MVAGKSGGRADIFASEGGCLMLLASQVVKIKIKGSHYSTESMFDFSDTMLNVSSWAANCVLFLLRGSTQVGHAGHGYKPTYHQSNLSHQHSNIL